jgi:hypothetical protein
MVTKAIKRLHHLYKIVSILFPIPLLVKSFKHGYLKYLEGGDGGV